MTKIRSRQWRLVVALVMAGHALWLVQACSSNAEDSAAADPGVSETGGFDATPADVPDGSSNDASGIAVADASADVVEAGAGPFVVPVDVVGVKGTGLVLQNNGGDDLAVLPNDGGTQTVSFATKIDLGKGYAVTVKTQPSSPAQTCSVVGGNGAAVGVPIAGITVTCVSPDAWTYFGACLTQLASGNADKVFRFYVETSSTPSGGGGQTMTWKMTPLSLGPDAGPPPSFTTAEKSGLPRRCPESPSTRRGTS